jgi:DNA-binding transcriptional LysR family regulator
VRVRLFEAGAAKRTMIEHGELHFAVTLALGHDHFAKRPIPPVQLLVLTAPRSRYGRDGRVDVGTLRGAPLLVMPPGYATRETFDAACRIAGVDRFVVFESAALNTLAAFAEAGHGIAIVPATFRSKGERVQIARLELRRKPVTMPLAILWDGNKPLPRFAENFPESFSAHVKRSCGSRTISGAGSQFIEQHAMPFRIQVVRFASQSIVRVSSRVYSRSPLSGYAPGASCYVC